MKISVVTIVRNDCTHIENTMKSVLEQTGKGFELEYVVIDGASTDGTAEIIRKYASQLAFFVSEKDSGIYNAMNKGISKCTGDVIGMINSGDRYLPGALWLRLLLLTGPLTGFFGAMWFMNIWALSRVSGKKIVIWEPLHLIRLCLCPVVFMNGSVLTMNHSGFWGIMTLCTGLSMRKRSCPFMCPKTLLTIWKTASLTVMYFSVLRTN